MCVIIYKPANIKLSKDVIRQCTDANNDGVGFASIQGNSIKVEKGLLTLKELWRKIDQKSELVIHFRLASVGPINNFFCHPFKIADNKWLFHNGHIPNIGNHKYSDTFVLSKILAKHHEDSWTQILEEFGVSNRFALVSNNQVDLIGRWVDYQGLKFSNMRWQKTNTTYFEKYLVKCKKCGQDILSWKLMCSNCGYVRV